MTYAYNKQKSICSYTNIEKRVCLSMCLC